MHDAPSFGILPNVDTKEKPQSAWIEACYFGGKWINKKNVWVSIETRAANDWMWYRTTNRLFFWLFMCLSAPGYIP
jgi:hypothetical protein